MYFIITKRKYDFKRLLPLNKFNIYFHDTNLYNITCIVNYQQNLSRVNISKSKLDIYAFEALKIL